MGAGVVVTDGATPNNSPGDAGASSRRVGGGPEGPTLDERHPSPLLETTRTKRSEDDHCRGGRVGSYGNPMVVGGTVTYR